MSVQSQRQPRNDVYIKKLLRLRPMACAVIDERAEELGLSFNAALNVMLDEYMRQTIPAEHLQALKRQRQAPVGA